MFSTIMFDFGELLVDFVVAGALPWLRPSIEVGFTGNWWDGRRFELWAFEIRVAGWENYILYPCISDFQFLQLNHS